MPRAVLRVVCVVSVLCLATLSSLGCGEPATSAGAAPTAATTAAATVTSASATTTSAAFITTDATTPPAEGAGDTAVAPVTITVVYDNHALRSDLQPDHGFACLVEGLDQTVLFDTGADGLILLANMQVLGIAPDEIDAVVLSHKHDDHTGGLASILRLVPGVNVYYPASFSAAFARAVQAAGATAVEVAAAISLCPGVTVTAPLEGSTTEVGLLVDTTSGPVLVTGCAHPGIVTMAEAAAESAGGTLFAVLGGFHLSNQSSRVVRTIIDDLKRLGIQRCGPAHCTGDEATALIRQAFDAGFVQMGAGAVIEF